MARLAMETALQDEHLEYVKSKIGIRVTKNKRAVSYTGSLIFIREFSLSVLCCKGEIPLVSAGGPDPVSRWLYARILP